MSGAEIIGIISGIIAIVDATVKVYAAATDASGLPEAFRDVAKRLPLVRETLQTAWGYLDVANPDEAFCNAMKPILEDCADKAKRLAVIFEKVVPQANNSKTERYWRVTRTLLKGDTVESLMKGVLIDVQLLTGNRVTKLPTESEIADRIQEAIERVSAIPPSLPGREASVNSDAERNTLLKSLKWTDPTLDKDRIERTKGGVYEQSSRWILAHSSYRQWRHEETKLLWIKGGAGKGKTMLLVAVTKELRPYTKLARPGADSFLSFFFCQNTDDRLNNAVAILKGLIYQLLVQDSSLISCLKDHYDRMGKEVFDAANNVNAFDALSNVFRQMIGYPGLGTIYLAVDALDECEVGLPELLDLIRETCLQENRLKWIVTSRNHVNVDESLALSLEVNSEAVLSAIEVYIKYKVSQVPSLKSNPTQRANVQRKLLDKADGTFLWIDLVLRSIHDALGDDIIRLIDEMPKGLPPLYDTMMRNIGMSISAYQASCRTILSIVTLTYRPLHLLELRMLADLEPYGTSDLEKLVDLCGSFLTLLDNHIYPIHQSAKEYLVSEVALGKIFPSGRHTVHRTIADRSVAKMKSILKRDIYNLAHPGTLTHEVAVPPVKDPLLGVGYSCAYWIDHVCDADKSDYQRNRRSQLLKTLQDLAPSRKGHDTHNSIAEFFRVHFLHWLEALSLLGVVTNGVFSLTRLRNILIKRDNKFVNLVEDLYRFILYNRSIIEQAPLQTYVSALLFTPVNSITRGLFTVEEPSWVIIKPLIKQHWSQYLYVCEGHSSAVKSVAFSQDGSRIVSGSFDKTIRIWDTNSGKEVHKLEGHSNAVTSVAFSHDGSRIVSGSSDETVRIWDAKSGKQARKLEGHSNWVNSVAFSQDGSRIVSGSFDKTVRIWDSRSGKEARKLEGHSSSVNSVAFSQDGSRIVSGSFDKTVRIWDAKSGKEVRKLEGHSDWVNSVAFSHDGSYIVSGSSDKTVRIWDAKSGKEARKLEGHSSSVNSVAFSQDGSRIVSGSFDKTVRIWDSRSGKQARKLEGHSNWVNSVAFSQDGSRIVSGSFDETVRIWDSRSDKEARKLEGHSNWVNSVAFSQDGSRIVSGSSDQTVRIWDTNSGKEVHKLEGHSNLVKSVAFSHDGSYIVSGSSDETVRIWDAKSGKQVRKLEGHSNWVNSVAFSQDDSYIASGSSDETVRIWDAKSGKEARKLEGHSNWVKSVAFSQDGSRVVSGSFDKTVRIWDTKSGKEVRKLEGHSNWVTSVAFSHDGSRVVSGSSDETVRIWDAKSGTELRTILMSSAVLWLRLKISSDFGLLLQTNAGNILADFNNNHGIGNDISGEISQTIMSSDQQRSDQGSASGRTKPEWGLNGDGSWITRCGRRTIWLPLDFRPGPSDVSRDGSSITIGCPTGHVVVIRMSPDVPFT
ncbi:WD40-repeat-containing domain protein [Truncatella angustata]|uniref:WD40-repeat-containing domain protein n=1 Tax=Truncatella angustata TaxID=152316 RepID=A0A9P8UFF5_9PEZI|nr:WD40-repeat-containing domain protein [Truncatella angustata]KAH6648991.1 WD40-repeat-containing domain protein [Truncatella angustata]